MKPEVVYTKSAPKTGFSEGTESPIAQGVKCGQFLFVSGQGPLDPATKEIVSPDLAEQTRVTLDNVKAVLEAGGTAIEHVVKVGVFLRSMDDFPVFNRVFKEYFKGVQPARTTVEASAPRKGVNVEIDCIARDRPWANLLRHTSYSVASNAQRTPTYASHCWLPRASSGSQLGPGPELGGFVGRAARCTLVRFSRPFP